jgi:hypothetical protein
MDTGLWAAIDPTDVPMTHAEALAAGARHTPPLPGDPPIVKRAVRRRPGTHVIAKTTPRYDTSGAVIDMIPTGTQVELNIMPPRLIGAHQCVLVRDFDTKAAAWVRADVVAAQV